LKHKAVVIGGGYVGLQEAVLLARKGIHTTIIDTNDSVIKSIMEAKYDPQRLHIKEHFVLNNWKTVRDLIEATKEYSVVSEANIVIIAVNTPVVLFGDRLLGELDNCSEPTCCLDFTPLSSAVRNLAKHMNNGVYINSLVTIYPNGTSEWIIRPLEREGYHLGRDIYVTHTPERVDPGNKKFTLDKIPRNLGYLEERSLKVAKALYQNVLEIQLHPARLDLVELSKLHENAFRMVNIAFVQESLAKYGEDIIKVVDLAGTKPFGFMKMYPSPYAGGSCLLKDSIMYYCKTSNSLVYRAIAINEQMPKVYASLLHRKIRKRNASKILFLGIGFKPGSRYYISKYLNPIERLIMELKRIDPTLDIRKYDPNIPQYSDFSTREEAEKWSDLIVKWNYKDLLNV